MNRIDIVALAISLGLFLLIVELVRRRSLSERYSLLWLLTAAVLIVLSAWRSALVQLAHLLGIYYAPSALMLVGLGFILLILLQYSMALSRLAEHNRDLAQRCAILAWHVSELEEGQAGPHAHDEHRRLVGDRC